MSEHIDKNKICYNAKDWPLKKQSEKKSGRLVTCNGCKSCVDSNDIKGDECVECRQDKHPNFRNKKGQLFLVRCFKCEPGRGRENNSTIVASGQCCWCGWKE